MEYPYSPLDSRKGRAFCLWAHPLLTYFGTALDCGFFRKHCVRYFDALWHHDCKNSFTNAQR